MKIKVDNWCLRNAKRESSRCCPIALAIQNTLGINYNCSASWDTHPQKRDERTNVIFDIWQPTSILNDINYLDYKISDDDQIKINEFVKDFDGGKNVNKFNFELNI